jgi:hypothetical protein
MAWTKIPAAAASIACAACIAAAAAVPGAEMQAAHFAETVNGDVQLSGLDDALASSLELDWLNGVLPLLNFAVSGGQDLSTFVPTDDWPGYAALSALWFYQNSLTGSTTNPGIEGIAAFSALPDLLDGNVFALDAFNAVPIYLSLFDAPSNVKYLESVNGVVAFQDFRSGDGVDAFVPVDDNPDTPDMDESKPGYAALSGLASYRDFVETRDVNAPGGY